MSKMRLRFEFFPGSSTSAAFSSRTHKWHIKSNGVHYGPYATQRDAIRAAVDAAHEAGRKGLNSQVVLQDQFRIDWTYGKDPYPPNSSDYL